MSCRQTTDGIARGSAKLVTAHILIMLEQGGAQQRSKFPGATSAKQVHLEAAFLGVNKAQGPGGIGAVRGENLGDAKGVTGDLDGILKAGQGDLAVQVGKAGAELPNDEDDQPEGQEQEATAEDSESDEELAHGRAAARGRNRGGGWWLPA